MTKYQIEFLCWFFAASLLVAIAIGHNPWPSAVAFVAFHLYTLADKYFHDRYHDENKIAIDRITADVAKLKVDNERMGIKSVFGGVK